MIVRTECAAEAWWSGLLWVSQEYWFFELKNYDRWYDLIQKKKLLILKRIILKKIDILNVIFKSSASTYYATKIFSILILGWVDPWFLILDLEYLEINFFLS